MVISRLSNPRSHIPSYRWDNKTMQLRLVLARVFPACVAVVSCMGSFRMLQISGQSRARDASLLAAPRPWPDHLWSRCFDVSCLILLLFDPHLTAIQAALRRPAGRISPAASTRSERSSHPPEERSRLGRKMLKNQKVPNLKSTFLFPF